MKIASFFGDIKGGIVAMLFALPIELIYGSITVEPLGRANSSLGIQAALWTCAISGVLALIFRGTPGVINGSSTEVAFILAALSAKLVHSPKLLAGADPVETAFVLIFLCTSMAGLIQCAFAVGRIGRLLRFIPYPVIAGIGVGAAVLMVKDAVVTTIGVTEFSWGALFNHAWHPASLLVALLTFVLCLRPPPFLHRIPVIVVGLAGGMLVHFLSVLSFGVDQLGPSWSQISGVVMPYTLLAFGSTHSWSALTPWLPTLLPYALAIAAVASIDSLHTLPAIEAHTHVQASGERELLVQGAINLTAGVLGGFPTEVMASRSEANVQAGARSRVSGLVYSLAIIVFMIFGGQLFGAIPHAVTAGLILYLAYSMIDDGTRRLFTALVPKGSVNRHQYTTILANVSVVVVVALVAIYGDMLEATGVGLVAAMLLFIRSSMKPVVRNMISGHTRHSLKVRAPEATEVLEREGRAIQILELEGVLFFGTAERLTNQLAHLPEGVSTVILDFTKVRDIDATAGHTLLHLARLIASRHQVLLICGASQEVDIDLIACGLKDVLTPEYWFHDADHALETAEETLLAQHGLEAASAVLQLGQTMLTQGFSHDEVEILETYLKNIDVPGNSALFHQADAGSSLFVASSGAIDICLPMRNGKKKRVACFAAGVIVGEMSFLENTPRSADGLVGAPSQVWELSREAFDQIAEQYPALGNKIMLNISRGLSTRLRATTQSLRALSMLGDSHRAGPLLAGQIERRRYAR